MKEDNLDILINKTYEKYNDEIKGIGDIEVPEMSTVIDKFHKNIKYKNNNNFAKKKISLVASFVFILFISTLLATTPEVKAFKFNIFKLFEETKNGVTEFKIGNANKISKDFSNGSVDQIEKLVSFEEAQEDTSFNILKFGYLPKNYTLESVKLIKLPKDNYAVQQVYSTDNGKIKLYQIYIKNNTEETIATNSNYKIKDLFINNLKIKLISTDNFKKLFWVNNNIKYEITVLDNNLEETEVKELIKNLK